MLTYVHAVSGYGACAETRLAGGAGVIFARDIASWGEAFFTLSFTTNLLATSECSLLSARVPLCTHLAWIPRLSLALRNTSYCYLQPCFSSHRWTHHLDQQACAVLPHHDRTMPLEHHRSFIPVRCHLLRRARLSPRHVPRRLERPVCLPRPHQPAHRECTCLAAAGSSSELNRGSCRVSCSRSSSSVSAWAKRRAKCPPGMSPSSTARPSAVRPSTCAPSRSTSLSHGQTIVSRSRWTANRMRGLA